MLEYLLLKNDNDLFLALKEYKGSINNIEPVNKVMKTLEVLR